MSSEDSAKSFDVAIIGCGGAGMMCAMTAGQLGRSVVLVDHSSKIGRKILISGGGRCNFTNLYAGPQNYHSANPHFAKSALSRYTPEDFIALVERHGIAYHEKKLGQLFCDDSAQQIVDMLQTECKQVGAKFWLNCAVKEVHLPAGSDQRLFRAVGNGEQNPLEDSPEENEREGKFLLVTSKGNIACESLVIATGGLSVPTVGATSFGYDLARHFGLKIRDLSPALDGFVFTYEDLKKYESLHGVSADSVLTAGGMKFRENVLFTHSGLSGPASLQGSLYWEEEKPVSVDLCPETDVFEFLKQEKASGSKQKMSNILSNLLPKRLAQRICEEFRLESSLLEVSDKQLKTIASSVNEWSFVPLRTVGYKKAEVTRGGVDTSELSSRNLESKTIKGLFFIGEVVDVTGQLGGFNFQWAWASGYAAGSEA